MAIQTGIRAETPAQPKDGSNLALQAAAAFYDNIRTAELPNGLRVFLKPVPHAPVVTTMVTYKVGSADEDLDNTGLSHYLEHLMFKGTKTIMPGDIDRLTLRNGGANNAYTSEDLTNYHFDFAADRWEDALKIEADRMRNLQIDVKHEFEQEKGAVIEELQRNEDMPWDLEQKAILPLLFGPTHPYGHPVIGERQHVRAATAEVIKAHYNKWYYPNNAVVVVCGGFDPDKALARIQELFGPIPRGKLPERKAAREPERREPVEKEIPCKFEVARMVMGFNTVRTGDSGYYGLEVVQALLSGGKTSRLYKKLVEGEEIAGSVDCSNSTGRYPGWFSIQVEMLKGKDRKRAQELVLAELKRLADVPVNDTELKRAKQGILAGAVFGRETVHGLADSIARGVTTNDLEFLRDYLPRIAAVTARDVQDAAKKFLQADRSVVVWSVPPQGRDQGPGAARPESGSQTQFGNQGLKGCARTDRDAGGGSDAFSLRDAKKITLDNGLTLLLLENHRLPIVVATAYVQNVRLVEKDDQAGIATLVGRLLDEGTARRSGPEIAELIENVGGVMSFSASGGTVKVLAPDRTLGLSLFFECLAQANFPKGAFSRELFRLLSQIDDAERQADSNAARVFDELVYANHPFGRPALGRKKTVATLTAENCAAFHRQLFVPNNTRVAIVGDFDSDQVIEEVKRFTASWKKGETPDPKPPAVAKPARFMEKILPMPEAVQLHFYMGHPGIRRNNPDYFKLLVMDYVLGTGPGFTDRLSARLRDREGLAYTVSANITSSATEEPGLFTCYIGTDPKNFARVKAMFLEELERIRAEPARAEEVEDAKKYLLGSLPFQFTSNERVASQLLTIDRYQLGLDYFVQYRKMVAAVTVADVQAVAQKYLDPARMVLVAAGPVLADGKAPKKPSRSEKKAKE